MRQRESKTTKMILSAFKYLHSQGEESNAMRDATEILEAAYLACWDCVLRPNLKWKIFPSNPEPRSSS